MLGSATGAESIEALEDAVFDAGRHGGHRVVLVVKGEIVEDVFAVLIHPFHPILNDNGDLVTKGRVVGQQRRHRTSEQ